MRRPGALRNRLAVVAVLTTGAWVLVLTVLFNVLLTAQLSGQVDGVLRARAAAVDSTVRVGPTGAVTMSEPANDEALDAGVWVFEGSRPIESPQASPAAHALARDMARRAVRDFREPPGSDVRLFSRPITKDGAKHGTIVVETSLAPYHRTSRAALVGSVALALLMVAGAFFATREVVRRALAPVSEMADQAAQWSAHDVQHRFGDAPRPEELRHLAATLDVVLDRIGTVLRHEQQLAGELSHELRTPLAVIAGEADLLHGSAGENADERERGLEVIDATVERMISLLDDLLAQAAQVITEAPGSCRVEPVARTVLDAVAIDDWSPRGAVDVPADLQAGVTADVLTRILTPLVGNAARYAATTVTVSGDRGTAGVRVRVHDDGPGVPPRFHDAVFEPGARADPDDDHPGAGLGLALARRLARAAGGDITLEDAAGNGSGATFAVVLPPG
ncbi:MAG TPA: HAMP domain-containing sensor histidine kinase [Actinomycetes bacterium]|nr:HAMP domain-containing sensor histidine kinase [Actinomycetes bacterium]